MTEQPNYVRGTIRTYSGRYMDPLYPDGNSNGVDLIDICHALSLQCRYNGHVQVFYSVAEHSLAVYRRVAWLHPNNFEAQLAALLHDAAEAYIGDMVRPLKTQDKFFTEADNDLMSYIYDKFLGHQPNMVDEVIVQEADRFLYDAERALITDNRTRIMADPKLVAAEFLHEITNAMSNVYLNSAD